MNTDIKPWLKRINRSQPRLDDIYNLVKLLRNANFSIILETPEERKLLDQNRWKDISGHTIRINHELNIGLNIGCTKGRLKQFLISNGFKNFSIYIVSDYEYDPEHDHTNISQQYLELKVYTD